MSSYESDLVDALDKRNTDGGCEILFIAEVERIRVKIMKQFVEDMNFLETHIKIARKRNDLSRKV